MQGSPNIPTMLSRPVTIRSIRRHSPRWTHPVLIIITTLIIASLFFIYNRHYSDGVASKRLSKSVNSETRENDPVITESNREDDTKKRDPKTGDSSPRPAAVHAIETRITPENSAQSDSNTTKNDVSDAIKAFTLRHQLPNYFLHGKDMGLASKYRSGNVVYAHNVKTGGTTVKKCIIKYGADHHVPTVLIHSLNRAEMLKKYEIDGGPKKRTLFIGDGTFTVCEYLKNRPCSYFTMFREPIARIVSEYLFCQQPDAGCSMPSVNASLQAWALLFGSRQFNNLLWKYQSEGQFPLVGSRTNFQHRSAAFRSMAAKLQREYPGIVTGNQLCYRMTSAERRAFLDHCLVNLENWFAVIGLTEDFDTSIDLYEEVYQIPIRDYYHGAENVGRVKDALDSAAIAQMEDDLRSDPLIMEALYEDFKIYEKAKEIMDEQKKVFRPS